MMRRPCMGRAAGGASGACAATACLTSLTTGCCCIATLLLAAATGAALVRNVAGVAGCNVQSRNIATCAGNTACAACTMSRNVSAGRCCVGDELP